MKLKKVVRVPVKPVGTVKTEPAAVDAAAAPAAGTQTENNITELVFILDRSGSMGGLEEDTIGGFNSLIEKQKQDKSACYVTTVLFDHEIVTLHDRVPLERIRPLTRDDYTVRGCTALIDAIGITIRRVKDIHRYLREEDVPSNVMFVITTDGLENASKRYHSDEVKRMIREQKKKGWEFLFIGANIDAVETAGQFGIGADRAVNYHADHKGTSVVFNAVSKAVGAMRRDCAVAPCWSKAIEEDYEERR